MDLNKAPISALKMIKQDLTDPFVTGHLGQSLIFETSVLKNRRSMRWDEEFRIPVCHTSKYIVISVNDRDFLGKNFIASTAIQTEDLDEFLVIEGWFNLQRLNFDCGQIYLRIEYIPWWSFPSKDIGFYFPKSHQNSIQFLLKNGLEAMIESMKNASEFVYIASPSLDPTIASSEGEQICNLLANVASRGVKVLVMLWNDLMHRSESQEAVKFFKTTRVVCQSVIRQTSGKTVEGFLEFHSKNFPHNETCVVVDNEAFVGANFRNLMIQTKGLIVNDFKRNFEGRWSKISDKSAICLHRDDDDDDEESDEDEVLEDDSWTVQLLSSISSDSAAFPMNRKFRYLAKKGGKVIDDSFLRYLIVRVRSCNKFIFIENQCFIGDNILPLEIAQKVGQKIAAEQEFKVYIITWPTQETLDAIKVMYRTIGSVINRLRANTHPQDYLNVFTSESPLSNVAIFDDEYVVVGSAGISRESLDGNMASELGIGCFQAKYIGDQSLIQGKGDIYKFRHELWQQRFGCIHSEFEDPSTWNCLHAIRQLMASDDWLPVRPFPLKINKMGIVVIPENELIVAINKNENFDNPFRNFGKNF